MKATDWEKELYNALNAFVFTHENLIERLKSGSYTSLNFDLTSIDYIAKKSSILLDKYDTERTE